MHAELAIEVLHVPPRGVDGDPEPGRGALEIDPAGQQAENVQLTAGQRAMTRRPLAARGDTPGAASHSETRLDAVDGEGVRPQRRNGLDDDAEADGLGEEAAGPGVGGLAHQGRADGQAGQYEHPGLGVLFEELARRPDRVARIGLRVHHGHLRSLGVREHERLLHVACRPHAPEVPCRVDGERERLCEDRVPVDHHHLQWPIGHPLPLPRAGACRFARGVAPYATIFAVCETFRSASAATRLAPRNRTGTPSRTRTGACASGSARLGSFSPPWAPWAVRAPVRPRCCAGSRPNRPRSSRSARRSRTTGGC